MGARACLTFVFLCCTVLLAQPSAAQESTNAHRVDKAVSLQPISTQEVTHASKLEQCRADQKLWFSKISDDAKAEEAEGLREPVAHSLSFQQLNFSILEMHDCARIDPESSDLYYKTSDGAAVTANNRLVHFLDRHNLLSQFLAEDAQGKR
jgi:hypothetical protein